MSAGNSIRRWLSRINPWHRESFSLNELDRKMRRYMPNRSGFFVEAGANDGIAQSNTLYYERYQGWTGILIEPIPELAERCRANRPKCIVESCALVPIGFSSDHIEMRYCNLMSIVKGGMKSPEEEEQHMRNGVRVQPGVEVRELSVAARTLSSILDAHGSPAVDLLSLDVEGFELQALQGLDLSRHRPRFLLIEARYRRDIDAHLAAWYRPVAELSHHDVLYGLR